MMASTADNDPFLQVQAYVHSTMAQLEANFSRDVLSLLNSSRPLLSSYLRIRSSASSSDSPELAEARNELEGVLKDLQADIEDLVESVKAVELDPYSFGLQIEEVRRRRQLVDEVGNEVENMRQELRKTVQQAAQNSGMNPDVLPDPEAFEGDEDYAAAFEQERQQEIMQEQDVMLDGLRHNVGNLRQQGGAFGQELEEQGQLLDEVDTLADRVGGKLQTGMKNLGIVIKRNEGKTEPDHQFLLT
jgi:member of the syntaxin family of t-SNAREs